MAGRPTKLTPVLEHAIVQAVTGGVPYAQACLLAGVSLACAMQWRERGEGRHVDRPSTPQYVQFVDAVQKAEAADEARRILRINQAGTGGVVISETTITYPDGRIEREVKRTSPQWQADAWHLERKHPDRYGRKFQADVNHTGEITLALEDRTRQANERLARLRRVGEDPDQLSA